MMAQENVVTDALRITGVLIKHSQEIPDCNHPIKEILKEALGPAKGPAPDQIGAEDNQGELIVNYRRDTS